MYENIAAVTSFLINWLHQQQNSRVDHFFDNGGWIGDPVTLCVEDLNFLNRP